MEKKTDIRVARTRKYLRRSLLDLMSEKPLDEITVKELAERAEVARGTFYLYYDSIPEMLERISDELYSAFIDQTRSILTRDLDFPTTCRELIYCPFSDEEDLRAFGKLLRSGTINQQTIVRAINAIKEDVSKVFTVDVDDSELVYIHDFIASGIASTITRWVETTPPDRPFHEIADLVFTVFYKSCNFFTRPRRIQAP